MCRRAVTLLCAAFVAAAFFGDRALFAQQGAAIPAGYGQSVSWNTVQLAQQNFTVQVLSQDDAQARVLQRAAGANTFMPYDTVIGRLEDRADSSGIMRAVVLRTEAFFKDVSNGSITERLSSHVTAEMIPYMRRLVQSANLDNVTIEDVRTGFVTSASGGERTAAVRVLGRHDGARTQAALRLYFWLEEGEWKISAMEGNLGQLLEPYEMPERFTPVATLGITQGL